MRSVLAIDVEAPAGLVRALVSDVTRWPALFPHYAAVQKQRLTKAADGRPAGALFARYVAIRPVVSRVGLGIPIVWRSLSWTERDESLRFRHVGGVTDGMEVRWSIEPTRSGCRVTIEHLFRRPLPIPLLGRLAGDELVPALVDRFVIRPIAARTLATVAALAGALARDPAPLVRDAGVRGAGGRHLIDRDGVAADPEGSPTPPAERKESHAAP